ncbi:MAG: dihydrolipoyl dehydrogenase [Candidatus Omnitrophica bacterium]|nr:dihydrolipoyl dehydrogenase [Candidatus Omnitrophota bacterium]
MSRRYEVAVIGSGPGGYVAALAAGRRGLRACLIEREAWGGVCLNTGCIPTKALTAVAHAMRTIKQASALGIRVGEARVDLPAVMARNARIIATLQQGLTGLLRQQGIELIAGEASFEDAHTLRLASGGRTELLAAERVIIATGAQPSSGPWTFDGVRRLSYRHLLAMTELPASLLIIGGGVIGCEFASCLAHFGVAVTIVEQQPQILPGEDPEAVRVLARSLQAQGVALLTGTTVQELNDSSEGVQARLTSGQVVKARRCLIAIGQRPNVQGLGLERLGIKIDGGIEVDAHLLTSQRHIAAVGDCLAGHGLAHLASAEGWLAVRNLCEKTPDALDRTRVPRCVYADPELAHVGMLESEAPASCRVSRFSFAALGKSLCDEEPEGFVKLVVDAATGRVLGATIVGSQASSLIHLAVLAIHQGLTARQLAHTVTAHPTLPEAVSEAAAQIYGEALTTSITARAPRRGQTPQLEGV